MPGEQQDVQVRVQGPQKLRETVTNTPWFLVLAPNHSGASAQAASAFQTGVLSPSSSSVSLVLSHAILWSPLLKMVQECSLHSHPLCASLCLLICCSRDLLGEIIFGSVLPTLRQPLTQPACRMDGKVCTSVFTPFLSLRLGFPI